MDNKLRHKCKWRLNRECMGPYMQSSRVPISKTGSGISLKANPQGDLLSEETPRSTFGDDLLKSHPRGYDISFRGHPLQSRTGTQIKMTA